MNDRRLNCDCEIDGGLEDGLLREGDMKDRIWGSRRIYNEG